MIAGGTAQGPGVRSRRGAVFTWAALFVLSLAFQYATFSAPAAVQAVHNAGVFELDGNAVTNHAGSGLPDDWDRVFNGTANTQDTVFVTDPFNGNGDHYFTGGGSKDPNPLSQWAWTNVSQPQDKNDIEHAYAAAYRDPTSGDRIAYFGLDRYADSGDGFVGFWFFKSGVSENANGSFSGAHTNGDILVQANFTVGGTISTFLVSKWENGSLVQVATGVDCASSPTNDFACAVVNSADAASPWSYTPKSGTANTFPTSSFFEAGLDLTNFGLDTSCFSTFLAETRSSQSLTSTLSDYALGQFSFCEPPNISTQVKAGTGSTNASTITLGDSVTDLANLSGPNGAVTGSVQFFLCGPGSSNPDCTTGGTSVGSATISSGTARSPVVTPTKTGSYCFRAEYTPDAASGAKYLPGSETNTTTECFTVVAPTLQITKKADAASVSAGDPIGFTITVTNAGPGTAKNVTLSDPLPAGVTWSVDGGTGAADCSITSGTLSCSFGDMAVSDSFTVHISAQTSFAACATYDNTATASADNAMSVKASDSITCNKPGLAITKTADAASVSAGSQIGFTVTVTNDGAGTAKGVTVSDPLPTGSGVSWTIAGTTPANDSGWTITSNTLAHSAVDLAHGQSISVHVVSGTTADSCKAYPNTATASASNNPDVTASATTTVLCPDVTVTKTAAASPVSAGDPIGFGIKVQNIGAGAATGVTLSDTLPAGFTWAVDDTTHCSITSGVLSCAFGTLAAGASVTVNLTASTTAAACGLVPNTATVAATNEPDSATGNNSSSASVTVDCPNVSITKTADASPVSAGDPIGFVVTVSNAGPGIAHGVVVTDPLPAGVTWTIDAGASSAGWSISGGMLTYGGSAVDLASGASVHVHVTATSTPAQCGVVPNTATVTAANLSSNPDIQTGALSATATITVQCPDVSITKTADAASVSAGSQIGFTVTVTNDGAGTAKGVTVSDPLPTGSGVSWTIAGTTPANDSGWTITSNTLAHSAVDLAHGQSISVHVVSGTTADSCKAYPNTATASASNLSSNPDVQNPADLTASASETVLCPDVTVLKTADKASVSAGDQIGFTVTIKNIGAGNAVGFTFTDPLPQTAGTSWSIDGAANGFSIVGTNLVYGPTTLAAGASVSVHVISPTTADSCSTITNTATVTATNEPEGNQGNNTSSASVVVRCGDVTISKVADAASVHAGDQIGFTVTVSNLGDGTLSGVTVTDPLPTNAGISWSIDGPANGFSIVGGNLVFGPASLAPAGQEGDSASVHIVSATTRATCGTVDNTASVTTTNDGHASASASEQVVCPFISISKANDADHHLVPGETVDYTLTLHVTNGPLPAVTIVDQLPDGVGNATAISDGGVYNAGANTITWNLTNVSDGKTLTYTAAILPGAEPGDHTNTATITTQGVCEESCSAESTVTVVQASIAKSNDTNGTPVLRGTTVNYTVTVTVVDGPAPTLTVVDQLPAGISGAAGISNGGTYDAGANTVTWHLTDVSGVVTLTYHAVVDQTAPNGASLVNTATITTDNLCTGEDCSATSVVNVRVPTLVIAKAVTGNTNGTDPILHVPSAKIGDTLTFTLTYTLGNGPVTNAVITDVLPQGYGDPTSISVDGTGNPGTWDPGTRTITWHWPTLDSSGKVSYQVVVLTSAPTFEQPLTNTATISSDQTAPSSASQKVSVAPPPLPATATPHVTPPSTSTVDAHEGNGTGSSVMLVLAALAALLAALGALVPAPARSRRRTRR